MLINNALVFNTLIGTGAPSLAWTTYDPIQNWARTELETLNPGSIVCQVVCQVVGAGVGSYQLAKVWAKRSRTVGNGENDYIAITTTAFAGTTAPVASDANLAAAPLGSIYVKHDVDYNIEQVYIKVNDTGSDVAVLHDWHPMLLEVTRTGTTFLFDSETYTLNIPVSGDLTDNGDGTYTYTPDNGDDAIDIAIPILTDNEDGTYTYDPNDGNAPITITATVPSIPADISAVNRPWVKVGSASATNATNIGSSDAIYHEGAMVRGGTSIGSTNASFEARGNSVFGANDNDLTGSNKSVIIGTNNDNKNADNALVIGNGNVLDNSDNGLLAGDGNSSTSANSSFAAGTTHAITGAYGACVGGANGKAGTYGATLGGRFNEALAAASVAIGMKSQVGATHSYAILLSALPGADPNADTDPFNSAAANEIAMRAGGYRIFSNLAESAGVTMAGGASSWSAVSDARTKELLGLVLADVLAGYKELPIYHYRQGEDEIGAGITAQDYYAAFNMAVEHRVGEMLAISQAERDGIQDLAIKQLVARVEALEAELAQYRGE